MMTPAVAHVFGRTRLQISTGPYVEVFREAAGPGERRRYTKRFLVTAQADLRCWTTRESRILAHLLRQDLRCVPALAESHQGAGALQTFDAGITVEDWATLHLQRGGHVLPHVFADCAHWWALAHHTLRALAALHALEVVHLNVTPDNVCVPVLPASFDPEIPGATMGLQFARLALVDFAFSVFPAEPMEGPLPVAPQHAYAHQSPRLVDALAAARQGEWTPMNALDWRCDLYSVAAMLRHYMPGPGTSSSEHGWTAEHHANALALLTALDTAHDREAGTALPHQALIEMSEDGMRDPELVGSLMQGFELAPDDAALAVARKRPQIVAAHTVATPSSRRARGASAPVVPTTAAHAVRKPNGEPDVSGAPTPSVSRDRSQIVAAQRALVRAQASMKAKLTRAARRTSASAKASRAPTAKAAVEPHTAPALPAIVVSSMAPASAREEAPAPLHAQTAAEPITATAALLAPPPSTMRPPRSRSRFGSAGAVAALAALAAMMAVGLAMYSRDFLAPPPSVASNDTAPVTSSTAPAPVAERLASATPVSNADHASTPAASAGSPNHAANGLPTDAATVQRAAEVEPRDARAATVEPHDAKSPAPPARDRPSAAAETQPPVPQPPTPAAQVAAPAAQPAVASAKPATPATQLAVSAAKPAPPAAQPAVSAAKPATPAAQPAVQPATPAAQPAAQPAPAKPPAPRANERSIAQVRVPAVDQVVSQTERGVERVMASAALAGPGDEQQVAQVARAMPAVARAPVSSAGSPTLARRLNAQARAAWDRDHDIDAALRLQQQAFKANPNDPEVAGNLAFFYLKARPAQPEAARRLAVYALAARGQTFPAGRVQDWGTFAIASSLEGREADAVKAMYVMLALSRNPDWVCRSARLAVAQYGDAMKGPARAMFARIRARGVTAAPNCA